MLTKDSKERLAVLPQYAVPQHLLSRAAGWLADCPWPSIKDPFIKNFAKIYNVDMSEAERESLSDYENFNDFFTRSLKEGMRPICEQGIASPADGAVSQLGDIQDDRIFQAKGHHYTLSQLLGGCEKRAEPFKNGSFATIYLSPKDYHRVHMPYAGVLKEMIYVPGKLFSVNARTTNQVPGLFARNERVVCVYETDLGPMVVVMVGAMIVASVETVWAGLVAPPKRRIMTTDYDVAHQQAIELGRGDEMGRFKLGSTAILLFPRNSIQWRENLAEGSVVRMGENIADCVTS